MAPVPGRGRTVSTGGPPDWIGGASDRGAPSRVAGNKESGQSPLALPRRRLLGCQDQKLDLLLVGAKAWGQLLRTPADSCQEGWRLGPRRLALGKGLRQMAEPAMGGLIRGGAATNLILSVRALGALAAGIRDVVVPTTGRRNRG